jgi:fermentation-respiration switch protein FrsA (DUF1100 family)
MLFWFVIVTVGVFAAISFYLYFNQKNMVFFPIKDLAVNPNDIGLEFENVTVTTADSVNVHGWYLPPDSTVNKVFLFCHGNAGNISHRLETIEFIWKLKAGVMIFDYRGFGRSDGDPSEEGAYADARACYDWLVNGKGHRPDDIIIFGRSLGGAIGVDLATKVPCGGLVVESSFTSAADMARRIFPILPTSLIIRYKFNTIDKISSVNCPVLVTHSPDDDIVPYDMGEKLYEAAGKPKQFVKLFGGHNDRQYLSLPEYKDAVKALMGQQPLREPEQSQ